MASASPSAFQWEFRGARVWHKFASDLNAKVEVAFQSGVPNVQFDVVGEAHVLDFGGMQQVHTADASRKRAVRRMSAETTPLWEHKGRNHWQPFPPRLVAFVERAFQAGALVARVEIADQLYDIDFEDNKQHSLSDSTRVREVRRTGPPPRTTSSQGRALQTVAWGVRVQRGPDWKWDDQDGGAGSMGTTVRGGKPPAGGGVVDVLWDTGARNSYRVGAELKYDLAVAPRIPAYWETHATVLVRQIPCAPEVLQQFQVLFDKTYSNNKTRDRKGVVPARYTVVSATRNENRRWWLRYTERRAQLEAACAANVAATKWQWPYVLTNRLIESRLSRTCNEVYLLHGTSTATADIIAQDSFKLEFASDGLLGQVFYFAESVTKADEYSPEGNTHVLLICRVALGCVQHTDKKDPDKATLRAGLASGGYHSILADRQATSGYREFAVCDATQVFPEYLVVYKRG